MVLPQAVFVTSPRGTVFSDAIRSGLRYASLACGPTAREPESGLQVSGLVPAAAFHPTEVVSTDRPGLVHKTTSKPSLGVYGSSAAG